MSSNIKLIKKCFINLPFALSCFIFNYITINADNAFFEIFKNYTVVFPLGAALIALQYAIFKDNLYNFFMSRTTVNKILSILGTIGIAHFYLTKLEVLHNIEYSIIFYIMTAISIAPFITILLSKLYSYLEKIFKIIEKDITKYDKITIAVISILLFILLVFTFMKASVFYTSNKLEADIVYTSDTLPLIKHNAWMNIYHWENDIRQPLFAVFSAPFVAPIYGITCWMQNTSEMIVPLTIGISNIFLLVLSAYVLSTLLEKGNNRVGFMMFYISTFSVLLFSIMLEQYVSTLFWIVLLIYMYINNIEERELAYTAAVGTLITNGILLPLVCNIKNGFRNNLIKMITAIAYVISILLAFSRFDIMIIFSLRLKYLMQFSGSSLTFLQKIIQYSHFIPNCFIAINDGAVPGLYWKLASLTSINVFGIIMIIICFISFILNRKDKLSRICFGWILFSFIIMCVVGWGTRENGLVLYSLYFSWAVVILIYKFIKHLIDRIKMKRFLNIVMITISISLFTYNLYDLIKMINYLAQFK